MKSSTKHSNGSPIALTLFASTLLVGAAATAPSADAARLHSPPEIVDSTPLPPLVPSITHVTHASECQYIDLRNRNSPKYYDNPLRYSPRGVQNQHDAAGATHVVCPLLRNVFTGDALMTDGNLVVTVYVDSDGAAPRPLWCELHGRDLYGSLVEVEHADATGIGREALRLEFAANRDANTFSLYCHLPDGDWIHSYRVKQLVY